MDRYIVCLNYVSEKIHIAMHQSSFTRADLEWWNGQNGWRNMEYNHGKVMVF